MIASPPGPLSHVACVSYPRSGHHVTERVLADFFGSRFRHCEFYQVSASECCKAYPCRNPAVAMSKNHDFGLVGWFGRGVRPRPDVRHLVLIRSYLEAAVSEYEMLRRADPILEDSRGAWLRFARTRARYYARFVEKWFLDGRRRGFHAVRYEDLTSRPLAVLEEIVRLFDPDQPVDLDRLQASIDGVSAASVGPGPRALVPGQGVRDRRRLEDFRWFDRHDFATVERSVGSVLARCGYPLRFEDSVDAGRA